MCGPSTMRYALMCSSRPRRITLRRSVFAQASGSTQATSTSAGCAPRRRSRTAPPTTYASGESLRNAGKSASSSSRNDIAQRADPLDLHFDDVAGRERPDPRGRAGEDDVARQHGHDRGDELDEHAAVEDHLRGVAVLLRGAVHARLDVQPLGIELGLDARPDRAKRIEALAARELDVLFLQVARGDVVAAGEAEDDAAPRIARDVLRLPAEDEDELPLVVDALRLRRPDDGSGRRQQRARRLEKDDRLRRRLVAELFGVLRIVAPDADDLARQHRWQQRGGGDEDAIVRRVAEVERIVAGVADEVLVVGDADRWGTIVDVAVDFHQTAAGWPPRS